MLFTKLIILLLLSFIINIRKEYEILLTELRKHNPELMDKDRLLAISKCDLLDDELEEELRKEMPEGIDSIFISSAEHRGLTELKDKLWHMLNAPA